MYRGLGLCTFLELTTPGPAFDGVGGARISSQDGCTIKLEPSGTLTCMTGVTEQGQGTDAMIAQVVATVVGVPVVEDCGRIINPKLVDEQLRGAIVQGIGAALWEHCVYDEYGQLLTGSMMDYLVPMAAETPPIIVGHVETPTAFAEGGFKGAGEAGTAGAPGAVLNAVNDALAPFGARVAVQPITPEVVLRALGKL